MGLGLGRGTWHRIGGGGLLRGIIHNLRLGWDRAWRRPWRLSFAMALVSPSSAASAEAAAFRSCCEGAFEFELESATITWSWPFNLAPTVLR